MERGELFWAGLPPPNGSGPGYRRPVLIIQANPFNRSRIQTVVVLPVTSNIHLAEAPGNVLLPKKLSALPRASVVNVSQPLTVDKAMLGTKIGQLAPELMARVDAGLRLVLQL